MLRSKHSFEEPRFSPQQIPFFMWLPYTLGRLSPDFPMGSGPWAAGTFSHTPECYAAFCSEKPWKTRLFGWSSKPDQERPCLRGSVWLPGSPSEEVLVAYLLQGPSLLLFQPSSRASWPEAGGQVRLGSGVPREQPQHQLRNEDCALKGHVHQVIKT